MFHGRFDYFHEPPLGSRPNTKPGIMALRNLKPIDLLKFSIYEDFALIEFIQIAIGQGLYTYDFTLHLGVIIKLHGSGSTFGHFLWALTIPWSQLLACM